MKDRTEVETVGIRVLYDNVFFILYVSVINIVALKFGLWLYILLIFTPSITRFEEIDESKGIEKAGNKQQESDILMLHQNYISPSAVDKVFEIASKMSDKVWFYDTCMHRYVYVLSVTRNEQGEPGFITNDINDSTDDKDAVWFFERCEEDRYTMYQPFVMKGADNGKK